MSSYRAMNRRPLVPRDRTRRVRERESLATSTLSAITARDSGGMSGDPALPLVPIYGWLSPPMSFSRPDSLASRTYAPAVDSVWPTRGADRWTGPGHSATDGALPEEGRSAGSC